MADVVVVGGGLGALRAAAALRAAGRSVVLLQEGDALGGLAHPDVPVGLGVARWNAPPAGWRAAGALTAGLYVGGAVHALPLSRAVLPALFPAGAVPGAAMSWGRTRVELELAKLIGGGREVRTYRDWLTQRYGAPVVERLFVPYCERRFGSPDGVTANVARGVHGTAPAGQPSSPTGGWVAELRRLLDGVEVRVGVQLTGLAAGCVRFEGGSEEGEVFVDLPPARVVRLLGEAAPEGLAGEVAWLRMRHGLEVTVAGGANLPFVTHVVDGPGQAYRFVRHAQLPGNGALQGHVSVQFAVEENDPLWAVSDEAVVGAALTSLGEASPGATSAGARVQRVANHHPVWVNTTAARVRRYTLALAEQRIVPVGRAGTFSPLNGQAEADYLSAVIEAGGEVRDAIRRFVEPPVRLPEGAVHLTDFAHA
jgi:hypothetical protein